MRTCWNSPGPEKSRSRSRPESRPFIRPGPVLRVGASTSLVPIDRLTLDGEDHWLSQAKTRLETLEAVDKFLALELGSR